MNINDLSNEQLNHLAAKAQDWETADYNSGGSWVWKQPDAAKPRYIDDYDPTHNASQAMDLLKKFRVSLVQATNGEGFTGWINSTDAFADTPERAIVLAVVVNVYGEDIDESELSTI